MITSWKVFNFKSIRSETELSLAPLTIFAGANSSGKSTLIQSILLVAQTLAHKVSSRSVVLNGAYARLGQFDDLRSAGSTDNQISIGWTCRPSESPSRSMSEFSSYRRLRYVSGRIQEITCEIAFDTDSGDVSREVMQIQPSLLSCQLDVLVKNREDSERNYEMKIRRSKVEKKAKKWLDSNDTDDLSVESSLKYNIELDKDSLKDIREEYVSAQPIGCILHHFLPDYLTLGLDMAQENARLITAALSAESSSWVLRRHYSVRNDPIPEAVLSVISDVLGEHAKSLLRKPDRKVAASPEARETALTPRDLLDRLFKLGPKKRDEIRRLVNDSEELKTKIANAYSSPRNPKSEIAMSRPPLALNEAKHHLDDFFSASVRYLGPLRDEPKPMYPLAPAVDPMDVGLRGEHTAAVLDLHKNRIVQYIPSSDFQKSHDKPAMNTVPLKVAVVDWLKYLGVANAVKTKDSGKFGHEMKVSVSGEDQLQDLTHVGVGVSQVLPILVTCLLAKADTTLIFEQPELHLHPKVQTLLGDFFLSMTALGKQCIVETHSEYLINRLRFRAAAATDSDRWLSAMKMYFVEQTDGTSVFREVKVNEYGAILDWPEGFFDQTQAESEDILRAAARKRKLKRGGHGDAKHND